MHNHWKEEASFIASRVSDAQKRDALDSLSEDDFRDRVIRPLYRKLGLEHVRDNCGADELGKDCIFLTTDPMGERMIIGVQTKTGPVNMAGTTPTSNLAQIETQLRTGLETPVILDNGAVRLKPTQMHLCTSGKVSNSARDYLHSKLEAHRIKVYGADELIEMLDKEYPEFWIGIDADRFPYVRELRRRLCCADDVIRVSDITSEAGTDSPLLDGNYLHLRLTRLEEEVTSRSKTVRIGNKTIHTPERQLTPKFVDIAVEALVDQDERLALITGDGGAGKTTALRRIAIKLIDKVLADAPDAKIPVVLKAKQVASWKTSLTDLLAAETTTISGGKSPISAEDLKAGSVAVLVDALEDAPPELRISALNRVLEFHNTYPDCPVVLTSRDYRSVLELAPIASFVHYILLPVGLGEVDGLIQRTIQKKPVDEQVVRTTLKRLHEQHGLMLSPMLVTVFLSSSDFTQQDLPPNMAEIFRKFTEQMIGRWDEKKGLHQQYEANTKDFLLRQLAFQMHASRVRCIPQANALKLIDEELSKRGLELDRTQVAEEIFTRSGLFRFDGSNIEWRHHLLQEYFAGRGVPRPSFFEAVANDEWWRTPMVFYFGDNPESFADLWRIAERAGALPLPALFDAAVTIGLATQACYLARVEDKVRGLTWVIEALARSMDEFRKAVDAQEGGGKGMMALCAMLCLGRDAVGTRTLARVPKILPDTPGTSEAPFQPLDPDRAEAWRIVGLLESGELEVAVAALKNFRPANRNLIFMVYLSVAWTIFSKKPTGEIKKHLSAYLATHDEVIDDMKRDLLKELRTLFFQMKKGKVTPIMPPPQEATPTTSGKDATPAE